MQTFSCSSTCFRISSRLPSLSSPLFIILVKLESYYIYCAFFFYFPNIYSCFNRFSACSFPTPPPTRGPYYTTNTYLCLGMDVISIWPDFYTQDTLCPKIYRSTDLGRSVPVVVLFVDIVREVEGGNNPAQQKLSHLSVLNLTLGTLMLVHSVLNLSQPPLCFY